MPRAAINVILTHTGTGDRRCSRTGRALGNNAERRGLLRLYFVLVLQQPNYFFLIFGFANIQPLGFGEHAWIHYNIR